MMVENERKKKMELHEIVNTLVAELEREKSYRICRSRSSCLREEVDWLIEGKYRGSKKGG